jgi:hypothetical protein
MPRGQGGAAGRSRRGAAAKGRGPQRSSAPAGFRAKVSSTCPTCSTTIPKGSPIAKWDEQWMHTACRDAVKARAQILAGETFRGQKASDWKLGSSPSSAPS